MTGGGGQWYGGGWRQGRLYPWQTPAQVATLPGEFVWDWPVQGPTDEGIRAADCWWMQNVLFRNPPACVDCVGPIPPWATNPNYFHGVGGVGDRVERGGARVRGFALGDIVTVAPATPWGRIGAKIGDILRLAMPDFDPFQQPNGGAIYADPPGAVQKLGPQSYLVTGPANAIRVAWGAGPWGAAGVTYVVPSAVGMAGPNDPSATLSPDQQAWVQQALVTLNGLIAATTGTACKTWVDPGVNLAPAVACFQAWYSASSGQTLRADGLLDEDTLCAMVQIATAHPTDFPAPFPDPQRQHCQPAAPGGAPAAAPPSAPAPVPAAAAQPPAPPAQTAPAPAIVTAQPAMVEKAGLSTGAKVGIGVAGVAVLGGIVFAATRGGGQRGRRR